MLDLPGQVVSAQLLENGGRDRKMTDRPVAKLNRRPELPPMFARYKSWVEEGLVRAVPQADAGSLYILLQYHLGWVDQKGNPPEVAISQGKALRPTLCLFACQALSESVDQASPAAAALELIHNFSLIHDDIQDQDWERRHQPTVWWLWGVPKALVAGNALQSVGDLALLNSAEGGASAEVTLRVSHLLTASYLEMIEGQCMDLAFESKIGTTSDEYLRMIACKTGALFRSGLEIGASLATDDPSEVEAFSRFGSNIGRAFQIRDDYLGIWGDVATLGKAAGNDIRRRKKSFPVVFALEHAKGPALDDLMRIYQQEELEEQDVDQVMDILEEVGAKQQSEKITEISAEEAIQSLKSVSLPAWARSEAEDLVDFLANREF